MFNTTDTRRIGRRVTVCLARTGRTTRFFITPDVVFALTQAPSTSKDIYPLINVIGNRQWTAHLIFIMNNHYMDTARIYIFVLGTVPRI